MEAWCSSPFRILGKIYLLFVATSRFHVSRRMDIIAYYVAYLTGHSHFSTHVNLVKTKISELVCSHKAEVC